jgi:hypothetical protein
MKETYILCNNQAERVAVLKKLEEEGYVWASGHKPTEYKILISDKVPIILKLRREKITVDDHIYRYSRDEVIKAMDFAKV